MKLFIYKFLQRNPFLIYLKDCFLGIFIDSNAKQNFFKDIAKKDDVIILTSLVPFGKMKQRPQQLALSLAKLYPEKIVIYYELDFGRLKISFEKITKNLITTNSIFGIKKYLKDKKIFILATGNTFIPEIFNYFKIKWEKIIFDNYDNLDGYNKIIYKDFLENLNKYDKIICSAKLLENQILSAGYKNTIYLPNGVNSQNWIIEDIDKLNKIKQKYFDTGKKVVGFYGGIEHWLDYDIIKYIIEKNFDKIFCFIGPDNGNYLKDNGILDLPNCLYLGYMKFDELKYYSCHFDIAIIPFKINKITDAVSPVKFFEYLIQGKPVITTGFKEILLHKEFCFVADTKEDFNFKIDIAIQKTLDENYKNDIINYAKKYEWDNLVKKIFID